MIAFVADWSGYPEIYLLSPKTKTPAQLTHFGAKFIWDISPPPDGSKLVISLQNQTSALYVLDLHTNKTTRLSQGLDILGHVSWSPDGNWLAFGARINGYGNLYRLSQAGILKNLTNSKAFTSPGSGPASPTWSPDGKMLVFDLFADYDPLNTALLAALKIENPEIQPLGDGPDGLVYDTQPVWNSTQDKILYIARVPVEKLPEKNSIPFANQIAILNPASGARAYLTDTISEKTSASWSPDQKNILYVDIAQDAYSVHLLEPGADLLIYQDQRIIKSAIWSPDQNFVLIQFGYPPDSPHRYNTDLEIYNLCDQSVTPLVENIASNKPVWMIAK
jgi:Tol biopolymer transport system component